MRKNLFVLWVSVLAVLAVGIHSLAARESIKYVGSSTVGVFIKNASAVYTDAMIDINTKPESSGGESAVAHGKADIGGVARDVKRKIIDKGVQIYLIGKDAIGVWINAENPIANLTKEQLVKIFTGQINNWKDVGGPDRLINVYIVNPQSATRKVFQKVILGQNQYAGRRIKTIRPDAAIIDKVGNDIAGIGQLSLALSVNHPMAAKCKSIQVDGEKASVNNPNYPITRPLHLITKGAPKGGVKKFIDWAISEAGQRIVKQNFIGIK